MPTLKYLDPADDTYHGIAFIARGEKGEKGDPGGSNVNLLDDLQDVSAPPSTPAGKLLGTTSTGVWGPVDSVVVKALLVREMLFANGLDNGGLKLTGVARPQAPTEGANKEYVDSRIWTGTLAQYEAVPHDPEVLYVVVG